MDAWWLSFYAYCVEVLELPDPGAVSPLLTLARECGWWWPFAGACIASEKPSAIHHDERGRLHCDDGPALDYQGTYGVWAIHGVRVPREVVEHPEDLHAATVLTERNAEVARVMLDRIGMERFIAETQPQELHRDVDGAEQPRRLLCIDTPNDPDRRVVVCEVRCPSTGSRYLLRVPPHIRRCDEAIAWTYGLEPSEYRPLVEA
jgi:hypothetical protein